MHDRGSHGASGCVGGVGFAKFPDVIDAFADDPTDELVGWVVAVPDATVLEVDELPGLVVLGGGAGGLTAKLVPVTTVTCAPLVTRNGFKAMMTDPDIESATRCAAASSEGFIDE